MYINSSWWIDQQQQADENDAFLCIQNWKWALEAHANE